MPPTEPKPRAARRRLRLRRRVLWIALGTVVGLFALVGASAGWFLSAIHVPGGAEGDGGRVTAMGRPDARVNVLLLGHDVTQLANGRRQASRSDTIMVASFDPLTREVDLLSIPRDTMVEIPGRPGRDKINAAHAYGGADLALKTVDAFLGVDIPDYVDVGVEGFQKIVDELGGVDVYVPFDMNYDDPAQDLHIHLKKGWQHLDGYQAMGFVRDRYDDPRNDFGRIDRQHAFLVAMAQKALEPANWPRVPSLVATLARYVRTTLDAQTILRLATIGHEAGADGIVAATLPTKDLWLDGISYQTIDPETVRSYVLRYVLGVDPVRNGAVRVRILNGTGVPGLAAALSRYLGSLGYAVVQVGDAKVPNDGPTAVYAEPSAELAGKVLVRTLHYEWPTIEEPYTAASLDREDREWTPPVSEPAASEAGPGWDVTIVIGTDLAASGVPAPEPRPVAAGGTASPGGGH
ncbi:MAG: LCP family protein [Clostridia bacterium]|nr:LCP family protein [Clostridia bacterium]